MGVIKMKVVKFVNNIISVKGKLILQSFIKGEEDYGYWENDIQRLLNNTARDANRTDMNENLKACCNFYGDHDINKLLGLDKYEVEVQL